MSALQPIILSGGSGTRLWPLSRRTHPKQFVRLGNDTLFGQAVERAMLLPGVAAPIVVCNDAHRFLVASILQEHGLAPGRGAAAGSKILLEPVGRNTAPAVAIGALAALEHARGEIDDPLLLVLSSDHVINPVAGFAASIARAIPAAENGRLVIFGVPPTRPETGFGYIQRGTELFPDLFEVCRFVEKPDSAQAVEMLRQGVFFWNSGFFLFRASVYLQALAQYAPEILAACRAIWESRQGDLDFIRFSPRLFADCPAISIDYAVMEQAANVCMTPLNADWSDMGTWRAFHDAAAKDDAGNAAFGDVVQVGSRNCYLHANHRLIAAAGLENLTVVETADAVLVMPRNGQAGMKQLLEELLRQKRPETESGPKVFRPWGSYETLTLQEKFHVKRIIVNPGGALSLQLHQHRAEHWVIVRGTAKITLADREFTLAEDESTYIPVGMKHRLENPGPLPLEIIEVQTGAYLGEDDIVRFEDTYGRAENDATSPRP